LKDLYPEERGVWPKLRITWRFLLKEPVWPVLLGISLHYMYENCFLNSVGMTRSFCFVLGLFTLLLPVFLFHTLSWRTFLLALFLPHKDLEKPDELAFLDAEIAPHP